MQRLFDKVLANERAEGKAEGKVEGKTEGKAEMVINMIGTYSIEEISRISGFPVSYIEKIANSANA